MKKRFDGFSGKETTGHEWDGLEELDNKVPRAFKLWLALSIATAALLWLLYPSWPTISKYSRGLLNYSSRDTVLFEVTAGKTQRDDAMAAFTRADIENLAQDPSLKAQLEPAIRVLYEDNCSACHGRSLMGQENFPNLTDSHWLWSGKPEEIVYTIQHGINHTSDETRWAQMPAFGEGMLEKADIASATEYVLSLSGVEHDAELAQTGAIVFDENCSACHNESGIGGLENGAPSLVDTAWIYGGSRDAIYKTIRYGRQGVMPGWQDRLSENEIKQLALYVIWAGKERKNSQEKGSDGATQ